jgi:cytochrome c biogenesis protein CcdA/thiol-disulfide isomerase/thioredoxin
MIFFVLAYLGGVLTIISPCILPVLPFVFARADRPFLKSGLPMLTGMAATFALVATLASVAGGWAVQANAAGRWIAMVLLALFGVTLLFPALADRLTRPLVALGGRLSASADVREADGKGMLAPSLLLGVATGLLWAPCAGPVLGLILTGAAISGANATTSLLLLAYALGAATSLALALLVGGRVFAAMKRSLGAGEWIRKGLGVAVLLAVVAIALGLDTGVLTKLSLASTGGLEQAILDTFHPKPAAPANGSVLMTSPAMTGSAAMTGGAAVTGGPAMKAQGAAAGGLPVYGVMPELTGATDWLNSPPLTAEDLKGKVVLIDFWTYSCINCLRALPYVEAWSKQYASQGLVVIGVHAPEFAFEKQKANVVKAIKDFGITYPVAMDNNYAIWKAFQNDSWPAHYFIDAKGQIRFMHSGEGSYDESETVIRTLLAERNGAPVSGGLVGKAGSGVEAAADFSNAMSAETYLGYGRAGRMASPSGLHKDQAFTYAAPAAYKADWWSLIGPWTVTKEYATNTAPGAKVTFSFHARDLHMVLGPSANGKPVRFRITLDGKAPGARHGLDTDADGLGTVTSQRLYQLVRQPRIRESDKDVLFQIEFLDPGAQAFTFTFG